MNTIAVNFMVDEEWVDCPEHENGAISDFNYDCDNCGDRHVLYVNHRKVWVAPFRSYYEDADDIIADLFKRVFND